VLRRELVSGRRLLTHGTHCPTVHVQLNTHARVTFTFSLYSLKVEKRNNVLISTGTPKLKVVTDFIFDDSDTAMQIT